MNTGMHGTLALPSQPAGFGCVDWYPYYRHPSDVQAEVTRTPGTSALPATRARSRPSIPVRKPAGLLERTDIVLIQL
jgi:hypothetical protein